MRELHAKSLSYTVHESFVALLYKHEYIEKIQCGIAKQNIHW